MKKIAILSMVTILCILGAGLLACSKMATAKLGTKKAVTDKLDTKKSGTEKLGTGKIGTGTGKAKTGAKQSIAIKKVFHQVVQVLHAPYDKDDLFFRLIPNATSAINYSKKGVDATHIGTATHAGKGTYTVTAAENTIAEQNQNIVYEYNHYQPNGSNIHVTGSMIAMYRSKGAPIGDGAVDPDCIGFNQLAAVDIHTFLQDDKSLTALNDAYDNATNTYFDSAKYKAYQDALKSKATAKAAFEAAAKKAFMEADSDSATVKARVKAAAEAAIENAKTTLATAEDSQEYMIYIASKNAVKTARNALIAKAKAKGIGKHKDTLHIDGDYKASLQFVYTDFAIKHYPITSEEYQAFLIDKIFTPAYAQITFTYNDESMILNTQQLKTLLRIV